MKQQNKIQHHVLLRDGMEAIVLKDTTTYQYQADGMWAIFQNNGYSFLFSMDSEGRICAKTGAEFPLSRYA